MLEPSKTTLPLKFLNCIHHSPFSTLEGTGKSWLNGQGLEQIQNIKPQAQLKSTYYCVGLTLGAM